MSQSTNRAYVTQPAPSFKATALLPSNDFGDIQFPVKGRWSVLFSYPLDFTFVCPTEIVAFSDRAPEFAKLNCDVYAMSCDSHYAHLAWTDLPREQGGLGKLQIPIISDITRQISKDYGVLLQDKGHPLRGSFVVDDKGILRQAVLHDPAVGRSVDETLRVVAAYQYTDLHGEVCPANWQPSAPTIKPSATQKHEYFSTAHSGQNGHQHKH